MKQRHYVSNDLVHWTGRSKDEAQAFNILKTICKEEVLRLTYCPTYVQPDLNPKVAMACFTDIPLKHSREHCATFGRFGIGFKKSTMIQYGANPVLYTTGMHFKRIRHIAALLARMKDLERDREWREKMEPYNFTEDETVALIEVTEFLREYSYKNLDDSDYVTYYQREWRLAFNSLPFEGGTNPHIPGMSCFYIRNEQSYAILKFAPSDVSFIVVPLRFWWSARAIGKALGCKVKAYELAVDA